MKISNKLIENANKEYQLKKEQSKAESKKSQKIVKLRS